MSNFPGRNNYLQERYLMNPVNASSVHVIVADLHRRITGVSTTIRSLLPLMRERIDLAFLANTPQGDIPNISLSQAWKICRSPLPTGVPFRIWHARRNNEMFWGLIFKHLFRCKSLRGLCGRPSARRKRKLELHAKIKKGLRLFIAPEKHVRLLGLHRINPKLGSFSTILVHRLITLN